MSVSAIDQSTEPPVIRRSSRHWFAAVFGAVVLYGWWRAVDQLRVEWSVNEQYSYGWAVPLLCAFLFWRRFESWRGAGPEAAADNPSAFSLAALFIIIGGFLFTRWIGEANPDWRLVSWALALEAIALSLLFLFWCGGIPRLRTFAFPLLFFLVAVPWPSPVEQRVVQSLTRAIVAVTTETLNLFGMPAVQHGNIIETAGGLVDVDEACSGIRSLQAALMISLFFGELHRFSTRRRIGLCAASFALACALNVLRTVALSIAAAREGTTAVQRWHDPAGLAILVGCFIGIWAMARWLNRGAEASPAAIDPALGASPVHRITSFFTMRPGLGGAAVASALLLLTGEFAIHHWYASSAPVPTRHWTAELPRDISTFKEIELSRTARQILRFNESRSGAWRNADGTIWQMIYLRWSPGRASATLARNHTPEICLPAAGRHLRGVSDVLRIDVAGVSLPFRCYTVEDSERPLYVFYSLWEDGAAEQRVATELLTWRARWQAVLGRHRNSGQRALHIAISGPADFPRAEASLRRALPRLIHPESS